MTILKVTGNQGFTLSLEDTFLGKPEGGGIRLTLPAFLGVTKNPFSTSSPLPRYFYIVHELVIYQFNGVTHASVFSKISHPLPVTASPLRKVILKIKPICLFLDLMVCCFQIFK